MITGERERLRLLQASTFTSNVDRFAIAPLLVPIGLDLHASLAAVAAVASGYYLAYGLAQSVWGIVSDRFGRVRVMRVALCGAAACFGSPRSSPSRPDPAPSRLQDRQNR